MVTHIHLNFVFKRALHFSTLAIKLASNAATHQASLLVNALLPV